MNDIDDEMLETELTRLQPRAPSRWLEARIATELAREKPATGIRPGARRRPLFRLWLWATLTPLATAAAFTFLLLHRPVDEFQAVSVAKLLYATEDEGIVTLEDGQPAQRLRLRYIDTITWASARGGASLQWSQPRDEIQILPLTYN